MKGKKLSLVLLVSLMLLLIPVISACGYTSERGDEVEYIPHAVDMRFDNCWVCHTGGHIPAGGVYPFTDAYTAYPKELCTSPACHPTEPPSTTTPPTTTTEPPTTTTEPPTTTTEPPTTTTEPPTTTTEPPTTTTEPTTSTGEAPVITAHPVGAGYEGLCLICHMIGGTDPMPDDHAGRTPDQCTTQEGCHTVGS